MSHGPEDRDLGMRVHAIAKLFSLASYFALPLIPCASI